MEPLGRPKSMRKDNIEVDIKQRRCESVNCLHLAQHSDWWRALVVTAMNLWVEEKTKN
jgi:hypothetical protein